MFLLCLCACEEVPKHPGRVIDPPEDIGAQFSCLPFFYFELEFEAGKRPLVDFKVFDGEGREIPFDHPQPFLEGVRVSENEGVRIYFREIHRLVLPLGPTEGYRAEAQIQGVKIAEDTTTECTFLPVTVKVPAEDPLAMKFTHDYFPLHSGEIIALEKSSGTASSSSGKTYAELEVIRLFTGGCCDPFTELEKDMSESGKIWLGEFRAVGIDDSNIPPAGFSDTMFRQVFAKEL